MKTEWRVLLVLASCCLPQAAASQETAAPAICVLDPESRLLAPEKLAGLGEVLREEVARFPDLKLLRGPALGNRLLRLRARCTNEKPACLAAMGVVARADRILFVRIGGTAGALVAEMHLVDVARREPIQSYTSPPLAGEEQLAQALIQGWNEIHGPSRRGQIKISSNVTGASIELDGQRIGSTPLVLTREIEPGEHRIAISAEGYRTRQETVRVVGDEGVTLHLVLEPEPEPQPPPEPLQKPASQAAEPSPQAVSTVRRPSLTGEIAPPPAPGPIAAAPAAPTPTDAGGKEPAEVVPLYRRWWFWTVVGLAVSAAAAGGIVYGLSQGEEIPAGKGRVFIDF